MKLRILRKEVYVSSDLTKFSKGSLNKTKDVLQYADKDDNWKDVPIRTESFSIHTNGEASYDTYGND